MKTIWIHQKQGWRAGDDARNENRHWWESSTTVCLRRQDWTERYAFTVAMIRWPPLLWCSTCYISSLCSSWCCIVIWWLTGIGSSLHIRAPYRTRHIPQPAAAVTAIRTWSTTMGRLSLTIDISKSHCSDTHHHFAITPPPPHCSLRI